MEIRRGLMIGMANAAQIKTGTYTGQGSISATFNIGFEPDMFIITRDSRTPTAGIQIVVLVKGYAVYNSIYYTYSGSLKSISYGNYISENDNVWGYKDSLDAYLSYATYSDGVLTLTNSTTNGRFNFISDDDYSWIAIKR